MYSKLKRSLDGALSARTLQPTVFPIDWTLNPICLTNAKDSANKDVSDFNGDANVNANILALSEVNLTENSSPETNCTPKEKAFVVATDDIIIGESSNGFDLLVSQAPFDFVLLTDCVFAVELAIPLINTILCCCGPRTSVICCHEIRDEVPLVVTFSPYYYFSLYVQYAFHSIYILCTGCKRCIYSSTIQPLYLKACSEEQTSPRIQQRYD